MGKKQVVKKQTYMARCLDYCWLGMCFWIRSKYGSKLGFKIWTQQFNLKQEPPLNSAQSKRIIQELNQDPAWQNTSNKTHPYIQPSSFTNS